MTLSEGIAEVGLESPDERSFPLALAVRYEICEENIVVDSGNGQTIEFGTTAIEFEADHAVRRGTHAELVVAWPCSLDTRPMELIVRGRVSSIDEYRVAMRVMRSGFRFPQEDGRSKINWLPCSSNASRAPRRTPASW